VQGYVRGDFCDDARLVRRGEFEDKAGAHGGNDGRGDLVGKWGVTSEFVCLGWGMEIRKRGEQEPFVTKDGSVIVSLLDRANAPVEKQSLAEARVPAGCETERHYHKESEEFYYVLGGRGRMEVNGEVREVVVGDAVLIPAGAWHKIEAVEELVFLCCCAPPYQHEDTYFD